MSKLGNRIGTAGQHDMIARLIDSTSLRSREKARMTFIALTISVSELVAFKIKPEYTPGGTNA